MSEDSGGRLARFVASQDGRVEPLPPEEQALLDLAAAVVGLSDDTDDEPKPTGPHRLEQARLGDRRPEFRELSDRVAELNRHSREGYR
jgi:hypothetical protein